MPHPDPSNSTSAELLEREFPLDSDLTYLNHAAVGPWPRRTAEAVSAFARENLHRGCTSARFWVEAGEARERLARLLGADDDDLAIVKNTSEAISIVAAGLDLGPGENVVLPACEFPSNRAPWTALRKKDVEVRLVDAAPGDRAAALISACDRRTRMIAASTVQYDDGVGLDLDRLTEFRRDHPDTMLLLDAIQSVGVLPIDVLELGADFVAGGSHKWLLAPEGVGYLYSTPEARDRITLLQHGWRMSSSPFNFGRGDRQPADTAHRFEPGTLNTVGMIGLNASLTLFEEIGMHEITRRILAGSRFLLDSLATTRALQPASATTASRQTGIVSFRMGDDVDAAKMLHGLKQRRVFAAERSGFLRFSPHFYTPREKLELAVDAVMSELSAT